MGEPARIERELFDVTTAAIVLSIGRRKVWQLIKSGELESVRIGNRRLIPRAALTQFVGGLSADAGDRDGNGTGGTSRATGSPLRRFGSAER